MAGVIAAAITGVLSLIGVIVSNIGSNKKIENKLEISQAVTDCKIDELTREVRAHNNFAQRMPVVENEIKNINNRLDGLEKAAK